MLDSATKRRIDTCRDILVGKVPDPKSQVEQITVALIYKFMDDMDLEAEELGGQRRFFTEEYERYRWAKLVAPGVSGQDMLNTYSEALTKMVENERLPALFRSIFRNAYLPYRDPETLRSFLREINIFTYDHSEKLGDAFEYLLSVLGSQGDAGQFRTPRHIIDFMVEIIDPQKTEVVLDPACGTAGFLISAYKHVLKQNSTHVMNGVGGNAEVDATEQPIESPMHFPGDLLSGEDRDRLARNIKGYDISPDMVRLSLVNLYLHGFADPKIEEYDTLTSEAKWTETADVILANPPFMSPKGGIKPHTRFQVQSTRSEVLFVDYMAEHLNPNGRAAIIVPEGIIFQSQSAYVALRKMLIEKYLAAVISLPAGVFNPYSGVKTSILILDRAVAKTSKHIAFLKIENDGFQLGAQRKAQKGSQLPQVKAELTAWLQEARKGGGAQLEGTHGNAVERERLFADGMYSLSGDRYTEKVPTTQASFPLVPLAEVLSIQNGFAFKSDQFSDDDGTPIIRIRDIKTNRTNTRYLGEFDPEYVVSDGDLLIGMDGEFNSTLWKGGAAILNQRVCRLHSFRGAIKEYVALMLPARLKEIEDATYAVTVKHISAKQILAIEIPLPPIEVQREIVAEIEGYRRVSDGARLVVDSYRPFISVDLAWNMKELQNLVDTVTPPLKLQTSEYGKTGELPIIDQSQDQIAGWTNRAEGAIDPGDGLVIFGDHTCAIKFVDRPFVQGADGIKILRPRSGLLSKYLALYLQAFPLEPDGYRRHFSKLKEHSISVPPLDVQRAIVAEIEAEQAIVNGNRELISRFEKKIDGAVSRVWGAAENDGLA